MSPGSVSGVSGSGFALVDVPFEQPVIGRPVRLLVAGLPDVLLEGVHLGVEVVHVVDDQGLQGLGPLGRTVFEDAVMAEDQVAELHGRLFGKIRDRRDLRVDHLHPHDDMADQPSRIAVLHDPIIGEFVDLPDIVEDPAGDQEIPVDPRIMVRRPIEEADDRKGVFQKTADVDVMKPLGRRRPS